MIGNDQHNLTAAQGYVELGMYRDSNQELESIEPEQRHLSEVLASRIDIYSGLEKWELMQTVASQLALDQPENAQWFVSWAHTAGHAESINAARLILLTAIEALPNAAVVH